MMSSSPFLRSSALTSAMRLNSTNCSVFASSAFVLASRSISSPSWSNCASTAASNTSGAVRRTYASCCPRGLSGALGAFSPAAGFASSSSRVPSRARVPSRVARARARRASPSRASRPSRGIASPSPSRARARVVECRRNNFFGVPIALGRHCARSRARAATREASDAAAMATARLARALATRATARDATPTLRQSMTALVRLVHPDVLAATHPEHARANGDALAQLQGTLDGVRKRRERLPGAGVRRLRFYVRDDARAEGVRDVGFTLRTTGGDCQERGAKGSGRRCSRRWGSSGISRGGREIGARRGAEDGGRGREGARERRGGSDDVERARGGGAGVQRTDVDDARGGGRARGTCARRSRRWIPRWRASPPSRGCATRAKTRTRANGSASSCMR